MKNAGRKVFHSLGGLLLLGTFHLLGKPRALGAYLALFIASLGFDIARLRFPSFNRWVFARLGTLVRPGEAGTISGSPTFILGVASTLLLFDLPIATAAVLFLAIGDVCASIVGEAWGARKWRGKSAEGTAAFVVAGFSAGAAARLFGPGVSYPVLTAGVVTAAAVELLTPRRLNDNLSVPLASAAVMTLLDRVLAA